MRFLIDEDMPRSLGPTLRAAGLEAADVRDIGLRGQEDQAIHARAVAENLVLISGELGFANIFRFRLGEHAGIIVTRFPNEVSSRI